MAGNLRAAASGGYLPACWMRGGTSKGLFVKASDLPSNPAERDKVLLRAMGGPDSTGLQLNGLGGAISSTSKVAVISPSSRPGFDVDYLFGQVPLKGSDIDWSGSCGNLSAAVGLFACQEGMVEKKSAGTDVTVRVWQANLGYEMAVRIASSRTTSIAGVPGEAPAIDVTLVDPNQGKPLLPTGNVIDRLVLPSGEDIPATLVLSANPTVFVKAADIGLTGEELPSQLADEAGLVQWSVDVCKHACKLMGIEYNAAVRLSWLAEASQGHRYQTTSGEEMVGCSGDLVGRITTEGRVHHAFTGTGAINLGCAAGIPGTLPNLLRKATMTDEQKKELGDDDEATVIRIIHPAGATEVAAVMGKEVSGWVVKQAGLVRTARLLMRGEVNVE